MKLMLMPKPYFILFKYTSRSRPLRFFKGLSSIVDNIFDKENYHIQCSFDVDDITCTNENFLKQLGGYENISCHFGVSTGKTNAINRDLDKLPPFDILINMSDDFIFTQQYFDDIIREAMRKYFPGTDGFIHFHDGVQPRLATMSIMGKKYFDRFGYIYHSDYVSDWSDNEANQVAKNLNKYKWMGEDLKIMLHEHPMQGGGVHLMDDLYRAEGKFYNQDKDTYFRRLANNFDLP